MRGCWCSQKCFVMFASFLPDALPEFERVEAEFDANCAGSALQLTLRCKSLSIVPSI